jgi:hypothetical protein
MSSFRCPRCERVSYNPWDAVHRYCSSCHWFAEQVIPHVRNGEPCWCEPKEELLENGEVLLTHRYPEDSN